MLTYKATSTLDNYLPPLNWTETKAEAECLLVGGKPFDLVEFPKLRGIFKTGVGTDNLPFAAAKACDIQISLPSEKVCDIIYEETAAFTCHLILSAHYACTSNWDIWEKYDRPKLADQHLLVIGAGKIGTRVIEKMQSFMQVDRFDTAYDSTDTLEDRLRNVDCVSLHIPLSEATRGFMDAERLGCLRDGAILVNTARGPVINEDALFTELSSGRIRAALDVFWQEPYRGKLSTLPSNVLIRTPHVASTCTEFLQGAASDFLAFVNRLTQ